MKKFLENAGNRTWIAVSGLISSILTSILYDVISDSNFEAYKMKDHVSIVEVDVFSLSQKIVLIILVYIILSAIVFVLIPLICFFLERLQLKKTRKFTCEYVVLQYNQTKRTIQELSAFERCGMMSIWTDRLLGCIHVLYKIFCTENKSLQSVVKNSFRNEELRIDAEINNRISPYEYIELIKVLENMLRRMTLMKCDHNKELRQLDLKYASEELECLKAVVSIEL